MAKNLIPEIAKMLGVELGEEFKIKGYEEWFYKFDNDRVLMFKHNDDVKMSVAPVSVYVERDDAGKKHHRGFHHAGEQSAE